MAMYVLHVHRDICAFNGNRKGIESVRVILFFACVFDMVFPNAAAQAGANRARLPDIGVRPQHPPGSMGGLAGKSSMRRPPGTTYNPGPSSLSVVSVCVFIRARDSS